MKKILIYATIIVLTIVITVGATYAYFSASTNSNNMNSGSSQIEIIYTNGNKIEGDMNLSTDKEGGRNTTVNVRQTTNSVPTELNLFLNVDQITSALAVEGLVWEVYKTYDGITTFVDSGTFLDCGDKGETKSKCTNGDRLYLVTDYALSTTNTAFTVYVWLDGNKVGNEVIGATFSGTIAAESNEITGNLS